MISIHITVAMVAGVNHCVNLRSNAAVFSDARGRYCREAVHGVRSLAVRMLDYEMLRPAESAAGGNAEVVVVMRQPMFGIRVFSHRS